VPPRWTFAVGDTQYLLTFLIMLLTGLVISTLMGRVQFQAESARQRERRTAALYAISRELAGSQSREQIARLAARRIAAAFDVRVIVLLPNKEGQLAAAEADNFALNTHEQAVAKWVFQHGQMAGRGTSTLPGAEGLYLPLLKSDGAMGVLGVVPAEPLRAVDLKHLHLLEAFAGLIGLALERADLAAEAERVRLDIETERLRSSLLSAVSHDLRTPLSVITGASSTLLESGEAFDFNVIRELATSIWDESERLNRLVSNLLDMTRLQAGALQVRKQWQPIEEVIGAALGRLSRQLKDRAVTTRIAPDLPFVPIDDLLIQQVLVNLLENAARHTPAGTPIEVSAYVGDESVVVEVADRGPGLPPGDPTRLFEKFYQAGEWKNRSGAGLGLAICRGIVQLHDGRIQAENRVGGGAVFRFSLPLDGVPPDLNAKGSGPTTPDGTGEQRL
jgi:two-component system sensor histidine kinase KdpD